MQGRTIRAIGVSAAAVAVAIGVPVLASAGSTQHVDRSVPAGTKFLVPDANPGAAVQIQDLRAAGRATDADLIAQMVATPQAVWVTKGDPKDARHTVQLAVARATSQHAIAVLVTYNIPGRDCGGLSAGGAQTTAEYKAWIDGFADGIANSKAIVILEPDGLGLLPSNCGGPNPSYPFTDAQRNEELNYAVDRLEQQPRAIVYLDGTHSAWLNIGDISTRLVTAGVQRAQGFFLNASNYQYSPNLAQYGTWISECIAYATQVNVGDYGNCPNQYWNGGPPGTMIAALLGPWTGVALDKSGVWSDTSTTPELNTSGINTRYTDMLGNVAPTTRFVVDTSRNGRGPWTPSVSYPDAQDWCNPPNRGLGLRATADTGVPLLDAYLWIKIPGESDGSCARGLGPAGTTVDPEWGIVDPAAGQWFPAQALQLAQLAVPTLLP
jgi:endoglucanase